LRNCRRGQDKNQTRAEEIFTMHNRVSTYRTAPTVCDDFCEECINVTAPKGWSYLTSVNNSLG
jgi:hypothetical protein